jgi:hypothetical protein
VLSITGQQAGDLQLRTNEQLTSAATETDQPETGRFPPTATGRFESFGLIDIIE